MQQADTNDITSSARAIRKPTSVELLWRAYQAAAREKRRIYALWDEAHAGGDATECERAEAACDAAYDVLSGIFDAIMQSSQTCGTDFAIQAELVARRERDLGGPCSKDEIESFCRDIQIRSGFLLPAEAPL